MGDQREDQTDPKKHTQRNRPKKLQTNNVPINDEENTNGTN